MNLKYYRWIWNIIDEFEAWLRESIPDIPDEGNKQAFAADALDDAGVVAKFITSTITHYTYNIISVAWQRRQNSPLTLQLFSVLCGARFRARNLSSDCTFQDFGVSFKLLTFRLFWKCARRKKEDRQIAIISFRRRRSCSYTYCN